MKKLLIRLMLAGPLLLACSLLSPAPTAAPTNLPPTPAATAIGVVTETPTAQPVEEPTAAPTAGAGEFSPAEQAARLALAADEGLPLDAITLVSTEAVEWPDGCLGVVLPGVACTEALVPGYRIILAAGDLQYEYHTNADGSVVLSTERGFTTVRLAVLASDQSVQFVDTGYALLDPSIVQHGLLPLGGAVGGTLYRLNLSNLPVIERVSDAGVQPLDFGAQPNYALAVWPGNGAEPPRLAFGTSPIGENPQSQLFIASVDGSGTTAVLTESPTEGAIPYSLVAQRWADDGQALYFSREPYGIGGYIPFNGASSLYRYDLASQSVTELIPFDPAINFLCLGDLDLARQRAVGNCQAQNAITVYDLSGNGATSTITPPAAVTEAQLLGSARLSPEGERVAFALARGEPDNEQGWVAVADGLSGEARLVLTSDPGTYYTVVGWIDDSTLLLQGQGLACDTGCAPSLWTVGVDGSNLTKVADGLFVAFVGGT